LAEFIPAWKVVQPFYDRFVKGSAESEHDWWYWLLMFALFLLGLVVAGLAWWLRRLAKHQLRVPLLWGLALSGVGRRITLEKIRANCPKCVGKMRYNKRATEWIGRVDANVSERRKVTKREPCLECKRNPEHCFWVDPAEYREE
jgi:hypothetical protein